MSRYDNRIIPITTGFPHQLSRQAIWYGSMDVFGVLNARAENWRINTTGLTGLFKPLEHMLMNWNFRKLSGNTEFSLCHSSISQPMTPSQAKSPPHLHLLS